jgi:hypothetical protein
MHLDPNHKGHEDAIARGGFVAEQEACGLLVIRSHTQKQKHSICASKRKANVGQKKREVGAPEEKEAKRQRTGDPEEEALRLHFKRQEEELKPKGAGATGGGWMWCCSTEVPICARTFLCRAVGCIDTLRDSGRTCGGVDMWRCSEAAVP